MSDFASLRRGREIAVSDNDTSSRVRYYSASPKMPRECQTSSAVTSEVGVAVQPSVADIEIQTDEQLTPKTNFGVNTDQVEEKLEAAEKFDQSTATDELSNKAEAVDQETMTITEDSVPKTEVVDQETMTITEDSATKTEVVDQETMTAADELSAKSVSIDRETMTIPKYYRNIPSQTIATEEMEEREVIPAAAELSTAAASSDAECQTETGGLLVEKDDVRSKEFDRARVEAVKKLLTSEQKQPFVRGTAISRSARIERNKGDDLEYITNKNRASSETPQTPASTPSGENKDALKTKVVLKKEIPPPPSNLPDPVPARIPRPKISKYVAPSENAETPDEEEEAADRLTPLRSELRSLGRWPRSNAQVPYSPYKTGSESDDDSDDSEGSYDTHEDGVDYEDSPYEITIPMREAMESLNSHLLQPGTITPETADWALKYVQHEWLKCTARKGSKPEAVDILIEQIKALSPALLKVIVNITDQNGNTALHYAVSHGNFGVVSSLLDSGECQLNLANRAGYSAVMLAALSSLENEVEKAVVQR
ncbi:ankyrin repeat protein [Teladorsagia circumcincta]|uniref:Ankyrin repeat protein n=1 Tax=Teladorsagia circumcincta TaxID=45464 RepID=A0A2G9UGW5_TELCI|nr:ankyrin repeat protein [Teladorsagia circumcincta]